MTGETFTIVEKRFGETVTIDLKPGGADIAITEENKKEYVDLMVEYYISKRVEDQFDAFISGFNELIPQDLITVFDERELELLIGGISEIDMYVFLSPFPMLIRVLRFTNERGDWAKFTNYRRYEVNDEVQHASLRMASGIYRAQMDCNASRLRRQAIRTNYRRVIHPLIASTYRHTRIMQPWSTS